MNDNVYKLENEVGLLISGLKKMSASDYLSARVLFQNNLLEQACIMSSQAIEKQLKVILKAYGYSVTDTHRLQNIFGFLKNKTKLNFENINIEFLKALDKIFIGRYIGDAKPGYNFAIVKNKFLAELDYTYKILDEIVQIRIGNGLNEPEDYKPSIAKTDPRYIHSNYLIAGITKAEFLKSEDLVFECRVPPKGVIVSLLYSIPSCFDDGKFIYDALVFTENGSKAKLCFKGKTENYIAQLNIGSAIQ